MGWPALIDSLGAQCVIVFITQKLSTCFLVLIALQKLIHLFFFFFLVLSWCRQERFWLRSDDESGIDKKTHSGSGIKVHKIIKNGCPLSCLCKCSRIRSAGTECGLFSEKNCGVGGGTWPKYPTIMGIDKVNHDKCYSLTPVTVWIKKEKD